ncbi:MAG: hypothetical protein QXK24_08430 [Ignisphaera sp.]
MNGHGVLRTWLSIAILLLILSLITLPFQDVNSPSYVINVLALLISLLLLVLVIIAIKRRILS